MLQISTERLTPLPLLFSANLAGDAEPPDGEATDPETPGGNIKPPTGSQPDTSERDIKPPTATGEPESSSQAPGDDIIIKGG